jgi:hypothetical protein
MSFDFELVVRGRRRGPEGVRKVARKVLAEMPGGELLAADDSEGEEDDDRELDLRVAVGRAGGTVEVQRLRRGFRISLDSNRDGNGDHWELLGNVATRLAQALGKVIEDEDLIATLLEESEDDDDGPELGSMVVMTLEDHGGAVLESARVHLQEFASMLAPGDMLVPRGLAVPSMAHEARRFEVRGAVVVAISHDAAGKPFRRHRWQLDGYGRITGVEVDQLG